MTNTETTTITAKPVIKWPGGKTRVIPELQKYFPDTYNNYHEPFIGGGAVFLRLAPHKAHISDINPELTNLYTTIKTTPEKLIEELQKDKYKNEKETYLAIRQLDRNKETYNKLSNIEKAARFIYMNKTGFNGLHRLNKKGQNNVAYGDNKNANYRNKDIILDAHKVLTNSNTIITTESYATALKNVTGTQNLIYLDPPYLPLNTKEESFTRYSKESFNTEHHEELSKLITELDQKGNYIILSNSNTPLTKEIYNTLQHNQIEVTRSIGKTPNSRTKAPELISIGNTLTKYLKQKQTNK